jgi:tetratricopeptide (TPR) repeat protein
MLTETDELKSKLKVRLKDPQKHEEALDLLFQLIEKLRNSRISEAWNFAREALRMAQQCNSDKHKAAARLALADCEWKMGQYSWALENYQAALHSYLQIQDNQNIARCYSGMGIIAAETEELQRALECFEHAMRYHSTVKKSQLTVVVTGNIGHTYLKLQRFEEAMNCFEHALEEHTEFGNREGMANMLEGMAGVLVLRKEYDNGLEYLAKVKELRKSEEPGRGMAVTMMNTGITLLRKGQFNLAKQELEQAHSLMEKIDFKAHQPEVLRNLMHACLELEDTAEFDRYMQIYEEFRHEDIIQQARDRHKRLREYENIQNRSIEQMLD